MQQPDDAALVAWQKQAVYFHYSCTKPIHRGKQTCNIRTMSAPAVEQLVLNRIRSLSRDNELFQKVMACNNQANRQRIKELREREQEPEAEIAAIDKKVGMITDTFGDVIEKDKEHVMAIEINRLDRARKDYVQKHTEARIEANDLESQTFSRDAARESLKAFTGIYRSLSPFDKKSLLAQLVHSVMYSPDRVAIRFYVLSDLDSFLIEKGAAKRRLGFAAPGDWRPKLNQFKPSI